MVHKIEYSDNKKSKIEVLLDKKVLGFLKFLASFLEIVRFVRSPIRNTYPSE